MKIDIAVESPLSKSPRVVQLSAMFDCPLEDRSRLEWRGELPIEAGDWSVGLIVGPSGCGKSTIARQVFGEHVDFAWSGAAVIDDFPAGMKIDEIAAICQAVGFNTIPAWMRPHAVLSTGEKFRVDLARRLLELPDPIVCDEFTSVVDRQVAKIGSHAVQRAIRKAGKKFVAVSCHHDIEEWLQPDWVLEPATMTFTRRSLRRRPTISAEICRVGYEAWHLFSRYHYLTASLNRNAACYCLFVEGEPVTFSALMHRPHPKNPNIVGLSRTVTLPDWQGVGLAFVINDALAAACKAVGKNFHMYPAHPSFIRSLDRSPKWEMIQRPGQLATSGTGENMLNKSTGDERVEVHRVRMGGGGIEGDPTRSSSKAAKKAARRSRAGIGASGGIGDSGPNSLAAIAERKKIAGVITLTGNHDSASLRASGKPSNFARRGGRPCAVFRYVGAAMPDRAFAFKLLNGE